MVELPWAIAFTLISCACISVGKAGYSDVRKFTALRLPCIFARIQSAPVSMCKPTSRNFTNTASKVSGRQCLTSTSPPAAATAHKKVPASIRSGMTLCWAPCSTSTPSMVSLSLPIPLILAPILTSNSAKSLTSGSRAAFSKVVVPLAKLAAINRFSVPVTVIMSVRIDAPCKRSALASILPPLIFMVAPIAFKPLMCWSTGLAPIAQPPGKETVALPRRANKGPKTKIEARMVLTMS